MRYTLLALCGLVVALSGCEKAPPPAKLIRPVLTQQVEIQPYYQEASYAGEVRARQETVLGFRVNGKIVERYVEVGDMVKPGDVLARLDDEDNTLRLTEALPIVPLTPRATESAPDPNDTRGAVSAPMSLASWRHVAPSYRKT